MPAKTFKSATATVRRSSKCFLGWTTIVSFLTEDREVAIFAPTKPLLIRAVKELCPLVEMDPKRFQRVAYFQQTRITRSAQGKTESQK